MKKARNGFIKTLPYLCLVGLVAIGLMTILATGGGGGGGAGGGETDYEMEKLEGQSDSNGETVLNSELLSQELTIQVTSDEGAPIQGINVEAITNGIDIFVIADDQSGNYFPNFYAGSADFDSVRVSRFRNISRNLFSGLYSTLVPEAHAFVPFVAPIILITGVYVIGQTLYMTLPPQPPPGSLPVTGIYSDNSASNYNNFKTTYPNLFLPTQTYSFNSIIELDKSIVSHIETNNLDGVYITMKTIDDRYLHYVQDELIGYFFDWLAEDLGIENGACTGSITGTVLKPGSDIVDAFDLVLDCLADILPDLNGDGKPDLPDFDGDGRPDIFDNCPLNSNSDQTDGDEDGYGFICDCDDNDKTTYPGAQEWLDWRDNNCDGQIDEPNPPILLTPLRFAVLDNGCDVGSNGIEWNFDWFTDGLATKWQIHVNRVGSSEPFINNHTVFSSFYKYMDSNNYIPDAERLNWYWKVRAGNDKGQWSAWSTIRYFDVEPVNTDCNVTNDDFEGTWRFHLLTSGDSPQWTGWAYGTEVIDANGNCTCTAINRSNGDPSLPTDYTMVISSSGSITIPGSDFHGIMNSRKDTITGVMTDGGGGYDLMVFTKQASTSYNTTDLQGTWRYHGLISGDAPNQTPGWYWGEFTFDQNGSLTNATPITDSLGNSDYTPSDPGFNLSSDGIITISGLSGRGVMNDNKNMIIGVVTMCPGRNTDVCGYNLQIMVKKSGASFSATDLAGTWYGNQLVSGDAPDDDPRWGYGTFIVSNAGNCTATWTSPTATDEVSGLIQIDGDGIVIIDNDPLIHGVMSDDKNQIVFTNGSDGSGGNGLVILMKRD